MTYISGPLDDLDRFQGQLVADLAGYLDGVDMARLTHAVESVTADWSVEIHNMRPVTDHHIRYAIHTPWQTPED